MKQNCSNLMVALVVSVISFIVMMTIFNILNTLFAISEGGRIFMFYMSVSIPIHYIVLNSIED